MENIIYLDNAATTMVDPEVLEVINEVQYFNYGNPSATHSLGRNAKAKIELARKNIASLLSCNSNEIIFTSGGTEAINLAFNSAVKSMGCETIITTKIEHKAVLKCAEKYQNDGVEVVFVNVDQKGRVDVAHLNQLLKENDHCFVSIMHANNEIGTINDIYEISKIVRGFDGIFHSDTVQTIGHIPINLSDLDIDFLTCSAHKLHGPKGVGFLYKNKRIKTNAIILGGNQESGQRAGTENITGICGMAKAIEIASNHMEKDMEHIWTLKTELINLLNKYIPEVSYNGDILKDGSLGTVLNVSFPAKQEFETLLFMLDINKICCSGGSACNSGAVGGSHVLEALNADSKRTSLRFSFSKYNTKQEIKILVGEIQKIAQLEVVQFNT